MGISIYDLTNTVPLQNGEGKQSVLNTVRSEELVRGIVEKIHELGKILGSERSVPGLRNVVDLTQTAAQVMPATVRIEMAKKSNTLFNFPLLTAPGNSHASGFVISQDGYIVTNHHVVNGAENIKAIDNSGRSFPAVVIGSDPEADIALLKIEGADFPYLSFADSDQVRVGEGAILIGNPLGYKDLLTLGVIGGKASGLMNAYNYPKTQRDVGVYADYLISDAQSNPGNSGGAVLNLHGEVTGVHTRSVSGSGIGIHIASNTARGVVDELMRNGYVTRSYFGALLTTFDANFASMSPLEDPAQKGLVVADLLKDSPAMRSGLQKGDVILRYNDIPITTHHTFCTDLTRKCLPGSELKLSILREGALSEVIVLLGSRKVNVTTPVKNIGIRIENLEEEKSLWCGIDSDIEGVLISEVEIRSPAGVSGLKPADVITGVILGLGQEVQVRNVDEFLKVMDQLGEKKKIMLRVRSPDRSRSVDCWVTLK